MNYAWLTAGFTGVMAFWNQAREILNRITSLVFETVQLETEIATPFMAHCWSHFKNVRCFGTKRYTSFELFVRPLDRYCQVPMESVRGRLTFLDGWRPLLIKIEGNGQGQGNDTLTASTFRGLFKFEALICRAVEEQINSKRKADRFRVRHFWGHSGEKEGSDQPSMASPRSTEKSELYYEKANRPLKYSWDDLGLPLSDEPFLGLAYPPEIDEFRAFISYWLQSEKWYKERGLPWRIGALLWGPPGSGKSSFVRAMAQSLNLPVGIFDLNSLNNRDLVEQWRDQLSSAPTIALFEDTDRLFDQDRVFLPSMRQRDPLSLNSLLNCISGVEPADGVITIVTANDVSKLDLALGVPDETGRSSRPGRLDIAYHFGTLTPDCRRRIAEWILKEHKESIAAVLRDSDGKETGAQFQKRCGDLALKLHWENFNKKKTTVQAYSRKTKLLDPRTVLVNSAHVRNERRL